MSKMSSDDPRHGTLDQPRTAVIAGCPCQRCEAARTVMRRQSKQRRMGKSRTTTPARALTHIRFLQQHGWLAEGIATTAGVSVVTVSEIVNGKSARLLRTTEAKILTVTGPPQGREIPSHGTLRRLYALAAIGYPLAETSRRAGLHEGFGRCLSHQRHPRVSVAAAEAITTVYDQLHLTPAPDTRYARHSRAVARNRGWFPPAAWDDIDDPREQPPATVTRLDSPKSPNDVDHAVVERVLAGEKLPTTRAEKFEITRRWKATGRPVKQLNDMYGWPHGRYDDTDMEASA